MYDRDYLPAKLGQMETQLAAPGSLGAERVGQALENVGFCGDSVLILSIKQYFALLRHQKGHHPDASPMDLELLLILKFVAVGSTNPVQVLKQVGIIIVVVSGDYCIAINNTLLMDVLCSSRSRINNTFKRLEWEMKTISNNNMKYTILKQVLDRADVRNWTIRKIPETSEMYEYVAANPLVVSGAGISVDVQFTEQKVVVMDSTVTGLVDFA